MFSLDIRSLALMRIVLGCAILRDLAIISSTLSGLLGDQSVIPPSIALANYFDQNYWTIHILSGKLRRQIILMIIHIAVAIAFTLGCKTKYSTPLLRFLTCSLQGANPIITNGGDSVVRLILLWCCFLPVSQMWSIDTLGKKDAENTKINSIATVGLILQMGHIYFWSYFLKTDPIRRVDYTATYYALSLDPFVKDLGSWLYQFPQLMKRLTMYTIKLELWGPLLYLLPLSRLRVMVCWGFIGFHLGLTATMYLGAFPRYAIAGWIGLLPALFWDTKLLQYIITKISTLLAFFINPMQQCLACTHPLSSKPSDYLTTRTKFPVIISLLMLCMIAYSFMRNLRTINFSKRDDYFPTSINRFGFLLRLDQYWAMFAPYPKIDDGWYNITGKSVRDGSRINISYPDRPPFDKKPRHEEIAHLVPHEKWRKLIDNLRQRSNSQYRQYFAAYLCRTHNEKATKYTRVSSINLTYMQENTKLDYQTDPVVAVDLGTWECKE